MGPVRSNRSAYYRAHYRERPKSSLRSDLTSSILTIRSKERPCTLNEFSARVDYVEGDARFEKSNFSRLSARKKVSVWAAKEFKNLVRMCRAGLPCPRPLQVQPTHHDGGTTILSA